ncbi:MAG TPA: hypothetical protein VJT16_24425 [Streptosporangiaceae bacterium]|nr:hypothetical protein [Streptosporangiaceae bacterium]
MVTIKRWRERRRRRHLAGHLRAREYRDHKLDHFPGAGKDFPGMGGE